MRPAVPATTRVVAALVLLVLGVVCFGLGLVFHATEPHAYADGSAPASVRVHANKSYLISVPGGVSALGKRADVATPECSYQLVGAVGGGVPLAAQPLGEGTNATDAVAQFISPVTGEIAIDCLHWGPVYVDNADSSGFDVSTALLVLASVLAVLAVGVGLTAIRELGKPNRYSTAGDDEQIERFVHAVQVRADDREVRDAHGGDIGG